MRIQTLAMEHSGMVDRISVLQSKQLGRPVVSLYCSLQSEIQRFSSMLGKREKIISLLNAVSSCTNSCLEQEDIWQVEA